jgi:hypothetical protein
LAARLTRLLNSRVMRVGHAGLAHYVCAVTRLNPTNTR